MDEHTDLMDRTVLIREALDRQQWGLAVERLAGFTGALRWHVRREETGLFRALQDSGELAEEIATLEGEHDALDELLDTLGRPEPACLAESFEVLAAKLSAHVEREDHGIFPFSVVTLGADGWSVVERAHGSLPTILPTAPGRG